MTEVPVLYSFRRCPYAMRARWALLQAGVIVQWREVALKAKPAEMLALSPKGTVPVLVLADGTVIDESLAVMEWALAQADPCDWRRQNSAEHQHQIQELIACNDGAFKHYLDRFKYTDRYQANPSRSMIRRGWPSFAAGRIGFRPVVAGCWMVVVPWRMRRSGPLCVSGGLPTLRLLMAISRWLRCASGWSALSPIRSLNV